MLRFRVHSVLLIQLQMLTHLLETFPDLRVLYVVDLDLATLIKPFPDVVEFRQFVLVNFDEFV
jgi:hypothetical protein